jgi:hypothetical protein
MALVATEGGTMTAPAVCEIGICGVLAIGRCVGCGQAFCPAHQSQWITGLAYNNLCGPCLERQQARRRETSPMTQASRVLDGAAERLTALGVPRIAILSVNRWNERKAFGRRVPRVKIFPENERQGWLLGPVTWRFSNDEHSSRAEPVTALLDDDSYSRFVDSGMIAVHKTEVGWEPLVGHSMVDPVSAAEAISGLEEQYSS